MRNYNAPTALHSKMAEINRSNKAEIAFEVQKLHSIDNQYSKVLISVPAVYHNRLTETAMNQAVSVKLGNSVRYLPSSLHRATRSDNTLFNIYVSRNNRSMSMEQASAEGFVQVSDTVFQDANDDIWAVVKNGDTAYLVQQNIEDVSSLLSAARSRSIATASLAVDMTEDYGPGMPVLYYDLRSEEVAFGVAVNGTTVFNDDKKHIVEVDSAQVLNVYDGSLPIDTSEVASDGGKEVLLSYMTQLYGHNKEFLAKIREIISKHVVV